MTEIKPWQDRVKPGAFTGVKMEAMLAEIAELRAALAKVEQVKPVAPVRPMSDEQIAQWMPVGLLRTEEFVYQKGIKDAEKFHGIKGATE